MHLLSKHKIIGKVCAVHDVITRREFPCVSTSYHNLVRTSQGFILAQSSQQPGAFLNCLYMFSRLFLDGNRRTGNFQRKADQNRFKFVPTRHFFLSNLKVLNIYFLKLSLIIHSYLTKFVRSAKWVQSLEPIAHC